MGMLQLAGVASGFGKGLQQGLSQMQATMSQAHLLGLRDETERARMRETFGHELGVLSMRNANDIDKIKLELAGRKEIAGQEISGRKEIAEFDAGTKERLLDKQQAGESALMDKRVQAESSMQDSRLKSQQAEGAADRLNRKEIADAELKYRASEGSKERALKTSALQAEIARDITVQRMRLDEAKATKQDLKLDPRVDAKMDFYKKKLDGLNDLLKTSVTLSPEEVADVKREYKSTESQINALLGFEEAKAKETRKPFIDPMSLR